MKNTILQFIIWALIGNTSMFVASKQFNKPFSVGVIVLGTLGGGFVAIPALGMVLIENLSVCVANCREVK